MADNTLSALPGPIGLVAGTMRRMSASSDVIFAIGILGILSVLLFPVPTFVLDFLLSLSITVSVLILMTVLFLNKPLEFNSFPTILLVAALFRLSLNIATTRLILSDGHEGTAAAGHIVEAFGGFVMGGSVVIGAIIFIILTIINFVVITKGAGRIAEVSARFTLDAMPGKQMAIDADLSSGLISEDDARARRKELENESVFFGAMDGASKFVRGDAIAGLLITFINFIGGIIIGVVQRDLPFAEALQTYTILTIGDGLVSQIPAIIVSTAAGLLVTKSSGDQKADKAILEQLTRHPQAVAVVAGLLLFLGLMPGMPITPFGVLAVLMFMAYRYLSRIKREKAAMAAEAAQDAAEAKDVKPSDEPIETALHIDTLRLELGYGLLPLINYQKGHRLTEQIKALRKQIAKDLGFIMPPVRIQDNMQLPANNYVIKIKDIEAGRGDLRPDMLMVMDPKGQRITIAGDDTTEPAFGLPARWISDNSREEALFKNYTVVDPPTVITTHLTEIIKDNIAELLSYGETKSLLDKIGEDHKKLVEDTIPSQISVGGVQRVLQGLLAEQVSIRDLPTILEAIAEAARSTKNLTLITEHVRARLARQISFGNASREGVVSMVTLSPAWEQGFHEAMLGDGEEKQLAMPPSKLQEFIEAVKKKYDELARKGELPVLLTSPGIRPYVRAVIERFRPATVVMSQNEIHPKVKLRNLGQV